MGFFTMTGNPVRRKTTIWYCESLKLFVCELLAVGSKLDLLVLILLWQLVGFDLYCPAFDCFALPVSRFMLVYRILHCSRLSSGDTTCDGEFDKPTCIPYFAWIWSLKSSRYIHHLIGVATRPEGNIYIYIFIYISYDEVVVRKKGTMLMLES